jgi:predicted small secreted protein
MKDILMVLILVLTLFVITGCDVLDTKLGHGEDHDHDSDGEQDHTEEEHVDEHDEEANHEDTLS